MASTIICFGGRAAEDGLADGIKHHLFGWAGEDELLHGVNYHLFGWAGEDGLLHGVNYNLFGWTGEDELLHGVKHHQGDSRWRGVGGGQGKMDYRMASTIITGTEILSMITALVILLSMFGINVSALILPAGVAVAFASKDLVLNFLAGVSPGSHAHHDAPSARPLLFPGSRFPLLCLNE
jgi:Mechanosensitive ion channel